MKKIRRLVIRLALSTGMLVVCLVVGEIATRALTSIQAPLIERHPVLGKRYRPGSSQSIFVSEAGRSVHLRFNRDGFRGIDLPYEKPKDVRRVAIIGDSYVVAVAVDEEHTAVRRLENRLNETDPEVRWQVQNFGISSSSTGQELVLYRELVSRYQPDLVICAYSMRNDFADNSRRLTQAARIYFDLGPDGELVQRPLRAGTAGLSDWLNRNSRLYVWQKIALSSARRRIDSDPLTVEPGRWVFHSAPTGDLEQAWEVNTKLIEAFASEVERRGSLFLLALLPCAEQVDPEIWQDLLQQSGELAASLDPYYSEDRLVEFCANRGIPVLTMTDQLRRAHQSSGPLFFNRVEHYNERGNHLAASLIHRFLTEDAERSMIEDILDPEQTTERARQP